MEIDKDSNKYENSLNRDSSKQDNFLSKDSIEQDKYYEYIERVFESHINLAISEIDNSVVREPILKLIEKRDFIDKRNLIDNKDDNLSRLKNLFSIRNRFSINNIGFQIACFTIIICSTIFYVEFYSHNRILSDDILNIENKVASKPISFPQDEPNAIITSVRSEGSSVMILESEDKKMTIIWYKEV